MSMTRKEAIKCLKDIKARCERLSVSGKTEPKFWLERAEALGMALSALRPVSRERVEKAWRGCRSCKSCRSCVFSIHEIKDMPCKKCDTTAEGIVTEYKPSNFCPVCGKPLTDEAMQMVMERMEALKDGVD